MFREKSAYEPLHVGRHPEIVETAWVPKVLVSVNGGAPHALFPLVIAYLTAGPLTASFRALNSSNVWGEAVPSS